MLTILYEDEAILVVVKPAGMESQSTRRLEPDMVSEIKKYRMYGTAVQAAGKLSGKPPAKLSGKLSTKVSTKTAPESVDHYVGVIHRLDKPVDGVMVYAKTKEAAASLSRQLQNGQMRKRYLAVICGKPAENQGAYVDYLWKTGSAGDIFLVDNSVKAAKRSELSYLVRNVLPADRETMQPKPEGVITIKNPMLSLVEIELQTGRYHQIRVQFAGRGMPLWGDARYNPLWGGTLPAEAGGPGTKKREQQTIGQEQTMRQQAMWQQQPITQHGLALSAVYLSLIHPRTGKRIECSMEPQKPIFEPFLQKRGKG